MISLECYSNFLFGLPASSLIPLQIVLHNADRIIFSKCTPKQQAMLQSSETLQHVMHSAKLFTSLLGFSLDSSTAYQAFTFWIQLCLWPQILSLTLFFYTLVIFLLFQFSHVPHSFPPDLHLHKLFFFVNIFFFIPVPT